MKGKSTISVIIVIMLLVGACTNNTKTDNNLKGNVKSIKTSSYNVEERFGRYEKGGLTEIDGQASTIVEYYSKSKLVDSVATYDNNGTLTSMAFYSYEGDKMSDLKRYDGNGKLLVSFTYSYNKHSNEVELIEQYDAKNNERCRVEQKRSDDDPNITENTTYDSRGNVNTSSRVKGVKKNGKLVEEISYDSDGNVKRVRRYSDEKMILDSVVDDLVKHWEYNQKGDVVYWSWGKDMYDYSRGTGIDFHYSYEYDSKGNWIKRTWYGGRHDEDEEPDHSECTPVYIQERVIEYY